LFFSVFYFVVSNIISIFAAETKINGIIMNTNISTASVSIEGLMAMLDSMTLRDRRRIAEHLSAQIDCEEREAEKHLKERMADAPRWVDDSDARLDSALARFHNDWGGNSSPVEIANELRQGAAMVNDVETW
jgi:hypothetical protein